jgi:hypothetical protein
MDRGRTFRPSGQRLAVGGVAVTSPHAWEIMTEHLFTAKDDRSAPLRYRMCDRGYNKWEKQGNRSKKLVESRIHWKLLLGPSESHDSIELYSTFFDFVMR